MKLQKPKGTQDILPQESAKWQYVEGFARETFKNTIMRRSARRYLSIMKSLAARWEIRLIL